MNNSADSTAQDQQRANGPVASIGPAGGIGPAAPLAAVSDHSGHNHGAFRPRATEGGLNLKPSGRTHGSSSLEERTTHSTGQTIGNIAVENPVFSCRDVNVYYGHKHALKKVSIDVGRKQVLAMIGPSGCGKSTFLRCLNRMNDTIAGARVTGNITLDGVDIHDKNRDVNQIRARVGMVFQKPNPFPKSIYDNVAYGPRIHGLARGRADLDDIVCTSLQKAGLWDEVKDRLSAPGTGLSGGQQQRLCIARTIAVQLDGPGHPRAGDRVIHSVQTAQEGRLAAAGGADHRQHLLARYVNVDVPQGMLAAVENIHIPAREHRIINGVLAHCAVAGLMVERRGRVYTAAGLQIESSFHRTFPARIARRAHCVHSF